MAKAEPDLRLGLIILALVAAGFLALFVFGPDTGSDQAEPGPHAAAPRLLDHLTDAPSRKAVEALRAAAPATYAGLETATQRAILEGEDEAQRSRLLLEALFAQFRDQAGALKAADSADFQTIITGLASGLRALDATNSKWCDGAQIASYLTQNEDELVPSLLSEFTYGSPQYAWAMEWMATVLTVAKSAQDHPSRWARPTSRDEALLQEQGLALGSQQWALALQVAAFANAEGVSYARMQEVIEGMDVCALGLAVETVSDRLPDGVRGRIWSDLLPEIMIGNTPYVMWRVTDYFFIG
ncbi:MAG: hypothetical protein AAFY82_09095 [Pseudomonadota bacterium]